jgi:hypothetical protein
VQGLKTVFFAGLLAVFFLFSNRIYSQVGLSSVEELSMDFRFVLQLIDTSESSRCNNFNYLSITVYSTINDSLIDKLYFCSEQDSLFAENFLQIGDFNFDGHTDFRMLTRKSTTLVERITGIPDYINDYDFYMFDVSNHEFYRHFISSLRQVKIDPFQKNVTGRLYNQLNNSSSSEKQPTSYKYIFNGEGLKYCTISPLAYPEPNPFFGNFAPTYRILEGRDLRSVSLADTLITSPIVKYESGFKFVKIRQIYPPNIDLEKNPNISYRNIYRIYSLANDQLLSEIIGEYEGLFGTRSDSIHTEDCNFDGYPDLIIKDEHNKTYTTIYFYNAERQKFYEYPTIKHLENLSIDFQRKTITGKNTAQAFEINKYGQLREPKKKIWSEYEFIGPSLKYVKMQTFTFTPKRGGKVKTSYYLYDNNSLVPIRKKEFLSNTTSM